MTEISTETAWRVVAMYVREVALSGAPLVDLECGISEYGDPFVVAVLEPRPPGSVFVDKGGRDYGYDAFCERIERQVREAHSDLVYPPTEWLPMGVRILSVREMDHSREVK